MPRNKSREIEDWIGSETGISIEVSIKEPKSRRHKLLLREKMNNYENSTLITMMIFTKCSLCSLSLS